MQKRGLSPVVATALLVGIAIILALIIFLWARSFIGEQLLKEGSEISNSCEGVTFKAEATKGSTGAITIAVENTGPVALYGLDVRAKESGGYTGYKSLSQTISSGGTDSVPLENSGSIVKDTTLIVVPVLLGENKDQTYKKGFVCDNKYGIEVVVKQG